MRTFYYQQNRASADIYFFVKGKEYGDRLFIRPDEAHLPPLCRIHGHIAGNRCWRQVEMNTPCTHGGTYGRRITRNLARHIAGNKFFAKLRERAAALY
jgi:hypothetical protein